jgi:hypothetical protein
MAKSISCSSILLCLALFATATSAFTVVRPAAVSTTALQMKFLKDMGFEKPSWLPDFDKKEEEKKEEPDSADAAPVEEEAAKSE